MEVLKGQNDHILVSAAPLKVDERFCLQVLYTRSNQACR